MLHDGNDDALFEGGQESVWVMTPGCMLVVEPSNLVSSTGLGNLWKVVRHGSCESEMRAKLRKRCVEQIQRIECVAVIAEVVRNL